MGTLLAADWFRRFLAGFAVGLIATLALSSGVLHAEAMPAAPTVEQAGSFF